MFIYFKKCITKLLVVCLYVYLHICIGNRVYELCNDHLPILLLAEMLFNGIITYYVCTYMEVNVILKYGDLIVLKLLLRKKIQIEAAY